MDSQKLTRLLRQLVGKFYGQYPYPDLRPEVEEIASTLGSLGHDLGELQAKAAAKMQGERLPPREFLIQACGVTETALDELAEHLNIPSDIIDNAFGCLVAGDLNTLLTTDNPDLLGVLIDSLGVRQREGFEEEWLFQFLTGLNIYRQAIQEGPIPSVDDDDPEQVDDEDDGWEFGDPLDFERPDGVS